ncbi:Rpn family recombination-promoting nuclease/putative transposase [Pseudoduganella sp. UC29_106]|uniref:Rpn family recombination-promoting nuclease/putative transposase n=1 Tax=Pseudoduganella sp. UC29_106 TaxID=3374553 RepID=UPI003757D420
MSASADISCKQLFAHPEVVGELLRIALPPAWLRAVRLQRCNGSYVSGTGRQRHSDMVWRIQRSPEPPIYLLLEFQSHPDYWMALRMQVYVGLLCEDLVRQQKLRSRKLPLLLPLVLYTGQAPWTSNTDLAALQEEAPASLRVLQPEQKYLLIDQSYLRAGPAVGRSVIASLLEFEQASDDVDLLFALRHVNDWLVPQRSKALKQYIRDWVVDRLRNEFRDLQIPPEFTLLEVHAMFNQRFATPEELWQWQAEQRAMKKGLAEGRAEGAAIGMLSERKRFVVQLLLRASVEPGAGQVRTALEAADAPQLEVWIDELLAGQIPAALR